MCIKDKVKLVDNDTRLGLALVQIMATLIVAPRNRIVHSDGSEKRFKFTSGQRVYFPCLYDDIDNRYVEV